MTTRCFSLSQNFFTRYLDDSTKASNCAAMWDLGPSNPHFTNAETPHSDPSSHTVRHTASPHFHLWSSAL